MTLPSLLVPKKVQTYLVWRHSDVISDVMSKARKSPKIAKIMVFRCFFAIFSSKVAFLAMMCVKLCLHMFLLQINQINKIKHNESVSWKQKKKKTRFVCNFHWKSVSVSFSLDPALYYATLRHSRRSEFFLNGLKLSARLEGKKSWSFSAKK